MNDENRQPIEDALRRYAEQRRRALRGPLAMPAIVRTQLHREIARLSAGETAKVEGRRSDLWRWLTRPWVWGGAAALVVAGLFAWQQFGPPSVKYSVAARAPAGQHPALTANPPSPAGVPAPAPVIEAAGNRLVSPDAAPIAEQVAKKGEVFKPESSAPLPVSLTSQPQPASLARSAAVPEAESGSYRYDPTATVSAPTDRAATRSGGASSGTLGPLASAPGRPLASRRSFAPAPESRFGAAFRAEANGPVLQQRYVQALPTPVTPVLNSFRIEQAGRQIQLVDADGSVYPATLSEPPSPQPKTTAPANSVSTAPALPGSAAKSQPQTISPKATAPNQSLQALALNAVGTNVRLQQQVVFSGNLLVSNLVGEPVITNQQALMTNEAALQFLLSNSRLEGQVIVGASNQFPIQAVPTPQ